MKLCPKCGGERTGTGRWCRACKNAAVKAYRATPEGAEAYRRYRESEQGRRVAKDAERRWRERQAKPVQKKATMAE